MTAKDTILFGKYQLIRDLGRGRNGTVFLALHRELQEYRAVKRVPKTAASYGQFLKEALLLKKLRHPGIPIVYDVFEDEKYSYLVEEFLEGNSLYDLVSQRGSLSQETAVRYGIQICDLIHYLHSAEDIPILYLDLQPRNLMVCHGQVKLLDFDHSDTEKDSNEASSRYGTPGYIAPEQRLYGRLGVYTDVYQIGAVLCYMLTGRTQQRQPLPGSREQLSAIIRKCLREERTERYASALEVGDELKKLLPKAECLGQSQEPSLIIALAGTRAGAGVTHLAIGLAVCLNRIGYTALYEEHNGSNDVRAMAENLGIQADSHGICTVFGLPMKPRYGQAVRLRETSYPVIVRDYGTDAEEAFRAAAAPGTCRVWLVRAGKWWERPFQGPAEANGRKYGTIYNFAVDGAVRRHREPDGAECCYRAPVFVNPFQPGEEAEAFYRELISRQPAAPGGTRRSGRWDCFRRKPVPRR